MSDSDTYSDSGTESEDILDFGKKGPEDADSDDDDELVDVDFEFFDPQDIDFGSVKSLLQQLIPPTEVLDTSDLADKVVRQIVCGTMLKVEKKGDVYGFATMLNIGQNKDSKSITKILNYLQKSPGAPGKKKIMPILEEKPEKVGLLLNERLLNLPLEVVPALYNSLLEDVNWAKEKAEFEEERKAMDVEYVLMLAPTVLAATEKIADSDDDGDSGEEEPAEGGEEEGDGEGDGENKEASRKRRHEKSQRGERKRQKVPKEVVRCYLKYEEELLVKNATASYEFPAPRGKEDGQGGPKADCRLNVVLLSMENLQKAVKEMPAFLGSLHEGGKAAVVVREEKRTVVEPKE